MKTISGCPPTDGQGKVQANPDTNLTATGASSGSMHLGAGVVAGVVTARDGTVLPG
jgi:hypothetical protein